MGKFRECGRKLKRCGYRLTTGREAVIEALQSTDEHLSVEALYFRLREQYPNIGLTTVYRTLDLLQQTGIVSKFDFGHGRAKFELSEEFGSKKHHHHLICTKCNTIVDYYDFIDEELEYVQMTESGLRKKHNFEINSHLIQFYGTCENCRNSGASG